MIETNVRLVSPGKSLWIATRKMVVHGTAIDSTILEKACSKLRERRGVAAVPFHQEQLTLLVAASSPVPDLTLSDENWEVILADSGEGTVHRRAADASEAAMVAVLIERALIREIEHRTSRWKLDSYRLWYEKNPFITSEGVSAYRRISVSSLTLQNSGIGIAADAQTSFFSDHTLDWYFSSSLPQDERKRREQLFDRLSSRQTGQKGTLLYDNGHTRSVCYFAEAKQNLTCGTTGPLRVRGTTYDSLHAYYMETNPGLKVTKDTQAIYVSFKGISNPQPVAADCLRLRIMNDELPQSLRDVDKLMPDERRAYIEKFWDELGSKPLGQIAPGVLPGFWKPEKHQIIHLKSPRLEFADGCMLDDSGGRIEYYRSRVRLLDSSGCFHVPPTVDRNICCAYPFDVDESAPRDLATSACERLTKWAKKPFSFKLVPYRTIDEAVSTLGSANSGIVLFVLNNEPYAYYEAMLGLSNWRIKRVTMQTLSDHHCFLRDGAWDRKKGRKDTRRGRAKWDSFITMTTLDLLQQMDAIPWRIDAAGPYEAQIVIDVSHDRRQFALSLLLMRQNGKKPLFRIDTVVIPKIDHQHEAINAKVLEDAVMNLVCDNLSRHRDPLESVLVLRDGRICAGEVGAIEEAARRLTANGLLLDDARLDIAEIHKESLKSLRMWDVSGGCVQNVVEGTAVKLSENVTILATTGATTLSQGTAEPLMISGNGKCSSVTDVTTACYATTHLNWSSPGVGQRLPLPVKRTDEELIARAQQEVRRNR